MQFTARYLSLNKHFEEKYDDYYWHEKTACYFLKIGEIWGKVAKFLTFFKSSNVKSTAVACPACLTQQLTEEKEGPQTTFDSCTHISTAVSNCNILCKNGNPQFDK